MGFIASISTPMFTIIHRFRGAMEDQLETDFCRKVSLAECEGDDYELREKKWEMEEESSEGNELTDNPAHQQFGKTPNRVHQFYFVKWRPYENPNADALIKRNEEIIENMNRSLLHITEQINERMGDQRKLSWQCQRLMYKQGGLRTEVRWWEDDFDSQQKALDRLSFANNAYSAKGFESCLSNGEIDKQKLHFQMLHGCRSMSDEKKILRGISASQKKDVGITVEELNAPIRKARSQMYIYDSNRWNQTETNPVGREAALRELNQAVGAKEKAIANAVVNGKLWNSLGSKEDLQNQLKDMDSERLKTYKYQQAVRGRIRSVEKSMAKIEKSIASLQKQQMEACGRKDEAYESILSLKKLYGEENARFYQYRLLLKNAKTLAEKKDIAALEELSRKEVEDFMSVWNSDRGFREDYKKRSERSLNARRLDKDGRRMKDDEGVVPLEEEPPEIIKPEALSKTRLKWLMKDRDAYYPSSSMILVVARAREKERFQVD